MLCDAFALFFMELLMTQSLNSTLARASLGVVLAGLSAFVATQASAQDKPAAKEKCYGVAKAGQNDCANASGTHSCAGQAKVDAGADEWKYVAGGTCVAMKGALKPGGKDKMMDKEMMDKPKT
jgi:uncharacterized membrane protein